MQVGAPSSVSDKPSVLCVVPCFNHGRFVGDAVRSALGQTSADVTVVVVNDGSDDGLGDGATAAACDACAAMDPARVIVVHQENRGLPTARNRGVAEARARGVHFEYVTFLDADDWVEPEFCAKLHAAIVNSGDERVSHAYCQERLVDQATGVWTVPEWDPVLLLVTNLHPVTCLLRRESFDMAGGFDESMRRGYEDWELWIRLSSRGLRGVRVREPLFNWRRHSAATMVMDAVTRHGELFGHIVERHRGLYERRAMEVIERSNALLRRADANWLDENLDAIFIRDLRAWVKDLVPERDRARAERDALRTDAGAKRAEVDALRAEVSAARAEVERVRAAYEAKPAVRLSRRLHGWLEAVGPLGAPVRAALRGIKAGARGGATEGRRGE